MEIRINREVRNYHESIFFGLSARQFGCSLGAVAVAVGAYFLLKDPIGKENASWLCMLCAAPLAVAGFFQYNGLSFERLLWRCSRPTFCMPDGGCIRAKTCMNSFCTFQKRKRGNASEEIRTKERACFCTSAENGPAVHSHPPHPPGWYLGGGRQIQPLLVLHRHQLRRGGRGR